MYVKVLQRLVVLGVLVVSSAFCHASVKTGQNDYARSLTAGELKIIYKGDKASPRISYAIEQVRDACNEVSAKGTVFVSLQGIGKGDNLKPEGFCLKSLGDDSVSVAGADQSGVLYGCLELAECIRAAKAMPAKLDLTDSPEFKLRGPALGMQKLGGKYLWPYTPKNFPFFYDKAHWREYLDFLVSIRMNSLYLWNGHPFASLVQLDDYPEALEVTPEILKKNREMFGWLTAECDKRGIWLIQMFYNIHLPKGLGLGTSLGRSNPKAADYTRKSIAKFVEEYPNAGLLVCLGEALSGKDAQVEWFTKTIIPGMHDGLKARGQTELPPIVVRGHHIVEHGSHKDVLSKGLKLYPNLFSMVKYNGESLTSETPRGKYQQYHKDMAKYSGTHMANMHLMSNLEPFRYADFSFIWNSCKAIRDRLDGNGLHLYPMNYWDWPNTPDKAEITQLQRDRLWFEIWARYCWKLDRNPAQEREHWIGRLSETYGSRQGAEKIYAAYDAYGECAPRILRRFGITGGNRQCMSLGMFLDQLTDPRKYRVWQELYNSDSPLGETITQYVNNEYAGKPHVGETPPQIVKEVLAFSAEAVEQIEAAAQYVTKDREEFGRLRNDIHCIDALSKSYCAKVNAAMMVHRYRHSKDAGYMKKALPLLEESLEHYKTLVELTRDTYRYSNGFHGRQRVPKSGVYHWFQLVGDYEKELADFRKKVAALDDKPKSTTTRVDKTDTKPWPAAQFKLLTKGVETYEVKKGAKVFTDRNYTINDIAPQLVGLTGMRFSHQKAKKGGIIKIDFEVTEPVKVLVGYFDSTKKEWLQVPMLEHVAHADDRGGIDPVLEDVADIGDSKLKLPKVNVHAFRYDKGKQTLEMIGRGSYVTLGVVPADAKLSSRAQTAPAAGKPNRNKLTVRAISPSGTTYYVDADSGDNDNPGTVPEKAWKTLAPVNAMTLAPGDKVLLKAGCDFAGPLTPQGSGAEGKPIVVDKYGHGANPIINGEGKTDNAIRLHNQHHWGIRNLTVTNTDGDNWDDQGRKLRRAIYVTAADVGDVNHIYLQNLEIRDVRGMYRFAGNQTNGGVICQVKGKEKKTRFVDLRIENCIFRTKSIDRYPVVVTSSWKKEPACQVVWKNNTLDHAGRAHIVIPADQWPRKLVYYFDPEARKVFPLDKTAAPISPFTGRVGCEDIFTEMAARLKRSWNFYEDTRSKKDSWLFAHTPGGKVHHVDEGAGVSPSYPLAYYGEMRAFGFVPHWLDPQSPNMFKDEDGILEKWIAELETVGLNREADWSVRNRVFMNSGSWPLPRTGKSFIRSLSPGGVSPDLTSREKTLKYFNSLPWIKNPYSACGRIGHALDQHMAKQKLAGKDPFDESYYYVKELIDKQFQPDKGYWGGQKANFVNRTSGNMKILCTYAKFDWKIPAPKKIIDYHLSGATEQAGFKGSGCKAFNQMHPLAAIFRQYPELAGYRGEEIDRYTAMTFTTFLANWDETTNFYGKTWLGKHNNGVPLFMAHLMLDLPIMRVSTVYNWREKPIITRLKNGKIKRNKVIYQKKGSKFHG